MRKLKLFFGLLAATLLSSQVGAYGPTGHRVIAELAYKHMTPEARANLDRLLGDKFLAEVATLPDEMRSNPDEFWQREANVYHYINVPKGQTYEESEKNPAGDALTALAHFTEILKSEDTTDTDRERALWFVVHIVGDLHQPLHTGHPEDRGGNRIDVVFQEELTNLHRVWDEHLIDHQGLSFTEWTRFLDRKITPDDISKWQASAPIDWVHEDMDLRVGIYEDGHGILSWDYIYKYTPLIKSQLSKGGIRLAAYLNEIFGNQ